MKTAPLVDWEKLRLPGYCTWNPEMYGMRGASEEARQRATALLLAHLDEQQRVDYALLRRFAVRGASGAVYILGRDLYPTLLNNGKPHTRFCAHIHSIHYNPVVGGYDMPMEDLVLTWKLFIEGDENGFRSVAQPTLLP